MVVNIIRLSSFDFFSKSTFSKNLFQEPNIIVSKVSLVQQGNS